MTKLKIIKSYPHWLLSCMAILVVSIYWGLIASDRYVSESNIVLESPQIQAPSLSLTSLFNGSPGGNDMLLLRDYLLSVDMLREVDRAIDFRRHYSSNDIDWFSRLYSKDVSIEELHEYYLQHISVELDDYSQILRIKVSAFKPDIAFNIAQLLLKKGEAHMNLMGQRLASEQVLFLEKQVEELHKNFVISRNELLDHQNKNGLISPAGTVATLTEVVASLEAQLANLKAKRTALTSYQSSISPNLLKIESEIAALNNQIAQERARMAESSGRALNVLSAEYQAYELKVQYAQESYSGALAALEATRIESSRKLKQVSILQTPTLPEYSITPKRLYNTVMFMVITIFLTLIMHMCVLIIKDHRD